MARQIERLSAMMVSKIKEKGLYPDGGNLYLQVGKTGNKAWLFRFMINGRAREMGLGALNAVSLSEARTKATACRKLLSDGIDPLDARKAEKERVKLAKARSMTFKQCAQAYIDAHKASWRNEKHIWQWTNTLERFAYPTLDKLPVQDVDVALVMKVLEPIWEEKTETATRLRGRIESILDWATARGYRTGENPARWRGHLENLLARPSKVQKVEHHAALPYTDINEFMVAVGKEIGIAALALQFVILTATRTSETIGAKWQEFNLKEKTWTIPAGRIKMGREHRVPLSAPAMAILRELEKVKTNEFVFTNSRGKPLSNTAMLMLLRRMGKTDVTTHGFRSSFRDWAAEQTNFAREVAEAALAHAIGDKVEAAYRRGDLFEKRKQLMNAWARYCETPRAKEGIVLNIRG